MTRNILALQQNVKTISVETRVATFDRAKRFYSLFATTTPVSCCTLSRGQLITYAILGSSGYYSAKARVLLRRIQDDY